MSKIDELLKDEKVEWKKLREIAVISKGKQFNKRDMLEKGTYPVINGGMLPSGYIDVFNSKENTITVSQGGASAGFVNFIEKKFWLGAHAFSVVPNNEIIKINNYKYSCFNRYLFHILKMNQTKLQNSKVGAGIPSVSKDDLSNIEIPLTSIETQEKIVEILDNFTNYVTELQAELQVRTKQYEYYRDMLLSEEYLDKITKNRAIVGNVNSNPDNIKMEKLKDCILSVEKIKWKKKKSCLFKYIDLSSVARDYHCITSTDTITADNAPSRAQQIVCSQDVLFGTTRPLLQRYCLIPEEYDRQICSTGFCVLRADKDKVLPKWILYTISSSLFLEHIKVYEKGTSYPSISDKDVKLFKIPVPSKQVQEYIIEILDKLNCLINDVSKGLPKEIELRQKQYEYYREKLLNFKK